MNAISAMVNAELAASLPLIQQPGVIAVCSGDRSTYPHMIAALSHVVLHGLPGGSTVWWHAAGGGQLARVRSQFAADACVQGFGWIWMVDDDNSFTFDTLIRLLRHDVDVVVPLVLQRNPPHLPTIWPPWSIEPSATDADLVAGFQGKAINTDVNSRAAFPPAGARGMIEIGHGSTGGMLIATRVLRALAAPHFEFGRVHTCLPQEDTWFCLRARRAGFRLWCDLDTPIGHQTGVGVWPTRTADGRIGYSYQFAQSLSGDQMRERLGYAGQESH